MLLPACIAMFTEEIGVSPLAGDGGALYRARVDRAGRRRAGRTPASRTAAVLFKAEVGAATRAVVPGAGRLGRTRRCAAGGCRSAAPPPSSALAQAARRAGGEPLRQRLQHRRRAGRTSGSGFRQVGTFTSVLF